MNDEGKQKKRKSDRVMNDEAKQKERKSDGVINDEAKQKKRKSDGEMNDESKQKKRKSDRVMNDEAKQKKRKSDGEMNDEGKQKKRKSDRVMNDEAKQKKRKSDKVMTALSVSDCCTISQLRKFDMGKEFDLIPPSTEKTFANTGKTVDKMSLSLMMDDISLQKFQMYPATILGDGNCLPRCASVLAYGHEEKHQEMREIIVCELLKNSDKYLDNQYISKGMDPHGYPDVAKTFSSYSELYKGNPLNKQSIRKLFELEVLSICKNRTYMGLWQLASLANIFACPVVSVYPKYGGHNVRKDMNRVFFPLQDNYDKNPVFIM
ncbi:VRTN-like protein [Mya arenaria]|uniref:VRTN-like protein n=1 Tax=Mya arenaria TaxID=6604 RepID=A0ABY7EID1_MYAAR|nr:VRTN-like protein [Mya arenaria]